MRPLRSRRRSGGHAGPQAPADVRRGEDVPRGRCPADRGAVRPVGLGRRQARSAPTGTRSSSARWPTSRGWWQRVAPTLRRSRDHRLGRVPRRRLGDGERGVTGDDENDRQAQRAPPTRPRAVCGHGCRLLTVRSLDVSCPSSFRSRPLAMTCDSVDSPSARRSRRSSQDAWTPYRDAHRCERCRCPFRASSLQYPDAVTTFPLLNLRLLPGEEHTSRSRSSSSRWRSAASRTSSPRPRSRRRSTCSAPRAATRCGFASTSACTARACAASRTPSSRSRSTRSNTTISTPVATTSSSATTSRDDAVQLAAWARDAIVLALPNPILCRADCAGLCPACGKNLNLEPHAHEEQDVDPRWAALEALRDET